MAAVILNTDSNINAKTVLLAEQAATVTGLHTFDRDPNPPFAVSSGSAVVPNLVAENVEGSGTASVGTLTLNSGQITFPGTQSSSANPNTLDDYEEGTWTPIIISSGGAGTATYTTQSGWYVKVGKKVTIGGRITMATKGTLPAGSVTIGTLPFTAGTMQGAGSVGFFGGMTTSAITLGVFFASGGTTLNVYFSTAAAAAMTAVTVGDVSTTFDIIFGGNYIAAN